MKQKELKHQLKIRKKVIYGDNKDLRERLLEAVAEGCPVDSTVEVEAAKEATDDPAALDTGARWHALVPDPLPVPEPANEDDDLRPPTMLDAKILKPKLEFKEEFRRMPFSGTTELLPAAVQTGKRKRTVGGLSQTRHDRTSEYPVRTEGGPNKHFLERKEGNVFGVCIFLLNSYLAAHHRLFFYFRSQI